MNRSGDDAAGRPGGRAGDVVILGCGAAAITHARTLHRVAPRTAVHFASRDPERARTWSRRNGGAGAFGSYEEALRDPRVSLAVVTVPTDRHLALTLEALDAGMDVVVEKPAFATPADFRTVADRCRTSGGRVFVAENYFYRPIRRRLTALLAEGAVGDPLLLRVNAVKRQSASDWRADRARAGGGGLFEGGIHWVNFMASLGLTVEAVTAYGAGDRVPASPPTGGPGADPTRHALPAEETLLVVLRYRGGAVGSLAFSWEVPSPLQGVRLSTLYGREGSIWFESNGIFLLLRGRRIRLEVPGMRDLNGRRSMWRDLLDAHRTGREPLLTLSDAERDVRLVLEAYRSAAQNRHSLFPPGEGAPEE
ncbi:MAG: Gfo/Idh/MocA family oxidoreductase [Longimicrobiales bacterium]|nr:Gfo/Idh/MocA family oxidoreductase [Longimicrobiales bacterium]